VRRSNRRSRRADPTRRGDEILYSGCYPRIHDQRLSPTQALADYLVTYVERDALRAARSLSKKP